MRINRYIAQSGYCSRRKADDYIVRGMATVNGSVVADLSYNVKSDDIIKVGGVGIELSVKKVYIALNKPQGYVSTVKDHFAENKVVDLLPAKYRHLSIVGRLDKESFGLVLMTDDGELCNKISHPKYRVEKEYLIEVKGPLDDDVMQKACVGIEDDGELLKIDSYKLLKCGPVKSRATVVLHQGRKREIRRIFKKLERYVVGLRRIRIGGLKLGDLAEGKFRILTEKEAENILQKSSRRTKKTKKSVTDLKSSASNDSKTGSGETQSSGENLKKSRRSEFVKRRKRVRMERAKKSKSAKLMSSTTKKTKTSSGKFYKAVLKNK